MKSITFMATTGDDYHIKSLPTLSTLPRPVAWFTDDVDAVIKISKDYPVLFEGVSIRYCEKHKNHAMMSILALEIMLESDEFDTAVWVDSDIINLGGVENLLKLNDADIYVNSLHIPHVNGGVYNFNLKSLREKPFHFESNMFPDDEHFVRFQMVFGYITTTYSLNYNRLLHVDYNRCAEFQEDAILHYMHLHCENRSAFVDYSYYDNAVENVAKLKVDHITEL